MKLDEKGRCCGRKPLEYKSREPGFPDGHKFCPRCDRAFDRFDGEQVKNWAWRLLPDGSFERNTNKTPTSDKFTARSFGQQIVQEDIADFLGGPRK